MMRLRYLGKAAVDMSLYAWRTGRWWMPVLAVILAGAVVLVAATKVVVPTVVYTLF